MIQNALHQHWIQQLMIEAVPLFLWQVYDRKLDKEHDWAALLECIKHCQNSTWWDWANGSQLLFWHWPEVWHREAKDGARAFHLRELTPKLNSPQVPVNNPWVEEKILEKLLKLVRRCYLMLGRVL
jgi:hypothetical protein